jgi:hypothetical protein
VTPDFTGGPVDPVDAHLDALGGELDRGVVRAERTRRQRFRAAGASSALVAIGLGALVALPGGRELDPVAEARAAVASGGGILHYVVRREFPPPAGSRLHRWKDAPAMEVWTATEGDDHYRVRMPSDGRPRFCGWQMFSAMEKRGGRNRMMGPALTEPMDTAQEGRTQTIYSSFSRAAVIRELPVAAREDHGTAGQLVTPGFGTDDPRDPVRAIRSALQSGALHDGGTTTIDGRVTRILIGQAGPSIVEAKRLARAPYAIRGRWRKAQINAGRPLAPTRYTYFVDAETFVPVQLSTHRLNAWSHAGGRAHWKWQQEISRFERFERLEDAPENRALLRLDLPAGTTIYRGVAGGSYTPRQSFKQAMRGERAAQRRCNAAMR